MRAFRVRGIFALLFGVSFIASAQQTASGPVALRTATYNVRDFGAKGDGIALDTWPIQNAIRRANANGGGTVLFTPGIYRTGTIEILSNVTLELSAGAVLRGSSNIQDYRFSSDFGFGNRYGTDSTGEGRRLGILVARNADNVSIVGRGMIDGVSEQFFDPQRPHYAMDFNPSLTRQGQVFMNAVIATGDGPIEVANERPGTMIAIINSRNVLMRDVTLRHSPNWTVHFQTVYRGVVEGVHVDNDVRIPNNDGFDCMGCHDVHFSNLDIRTGDDDFAIVGSENITVTNVSMTSYSSAIRVEDTRYSTFSNLAIHANRGIGLYERGSGRTNHVLFSDIALDTFLVTGHWWGKGEPIYIAVGETNGKAGEVRDVRFSNITGEAENGIVLYGSPKGDVENIAMDHIDLKLRVTRPEINAAIAGNLDLRWTASGPANSIFKHDSSGLYARYVRGLSINDFRLQWADNLPDLYSSAVEVEDAHDVEIGRLRARQANPASTMPVIDLHRVQDISIRDSTAAPGASTFVRLEQVTGQRLFAGNDLSVARHAFSGPAHFALRGNLMPAAAGGR